MDWQTLGQEIRRRRKAAGLRQEDLGREAGVTYQAISLLERGESGASVETLEGIARALGGELVLRLATPDEAEDPLIVAVRRSLPALPDAARRALVAQLDVWVASAQERAAGE